jgi:hypothetical protein
MLPPRALPAGRLAALDATTNFSVFIDLSATES